MKVAKVDSAVIKTAMKLRWKDFEDCVQFVAAKKTHAKVILTRNEKDFATADVTVCSPEEFVSTFV